MSTATAFITACLHNPHADAHAIALALRRASPLARPNEALIKLADAAFKDVAFIDIRSYKDGDTWKGTKLAHYRHLLGKDYDNGEPDEITVTGVGTVSVGATTAISGSIGRVTKPVAM